LALVTVYGLAGVGVAAFTPSALSLVGDAAAPGKIGAAFAWYTTAHYGAIGVGSFLGGLAAGWWGFRVAFLASAACIALAVVGGLATSLGPPMAARRTCPVTFADIRSNGHVWAGWLIGVSGLLTQGVVFTFWPLLALQRGFTPGAI